MLQFLYKNTIWVDKLLPYFTIKWHLVQYKITETQLLLQSLVTPSYFLQANLRHVSASLQNSFSLKKKE